MKGSNEVGMSMPYKNNTGRTWTTEVADALYVSSTMAVILAVVTIISIVF